MRKILKVSLRQKAIFIPADQLSESEIVMNESIAFLVADLAKAGFTVSEKLLIALKKSSPDYLQIILEEIQEIMGLRKNWTPLVKGWNKPTGESVIDHIITYFANLFPMSGTRLSCGHLIPENTFLLERYNGCPFCGTPMEFGEIEKYGQSNKMKELYLWNEQDADAYFLNLLQSKTVLNATQADSLKSLLSVLPLPQASIVMKETLVMVVDTLISHNRGEEAHLILTSPTDILRYLWYRQTGFLQIIEPKVLIERTTENNKHMLSGQGQQESARQICAANLKLKYDRKQAKMVAQWLNKLPLESNKACELMHPKRGMWIRFIRALRLAEYSKRKGYQNLKEILDRFYKQEYYVWQGAVNQNRLRYNAEATFALLKQRPGLFSRSLFANMLWFGHEVTIAAFGEIIDKIPARLLLSLNMYAQQYFDKDNERMVKPLGGVPKKIAPNQLVNIYSEDQLKEMRSAIKNLTLQDMSNRFSRRNTKSSSIFIDPALFNIPLPIGDRNESIQDLPSALMGTRFSLEGDTIRLFMQWGTGCAAQHLDMDLSCIIAYPYKTDICSYRQLTVTGCKHSGDIRSIPNKVGTAEYIDLDLKSLKHAGARYATFTCNAYSIGSLTPNMVVGWMNSRYPMTISERSGVAYDPSCVQQQMRITKGLTKGLVFGVLDVEKKEIIWMEIPFAGQIAQNLNAGQIEIFIHKLENKITIGQLLEVKAKAQNLEMVESEEADEVYTSKWAMDTAAVTALLID